MQYALYRKYRPVDFSSVVGQTAVIKTLKNSIVDKNFSHAYLFFGSRGTGKTTVSKIFARTINCLDLKDGEACGKCNNCLASFDKNCPDILEIDAASNNGVDEIRELRNNISIVPSELSYKVYIIDEVHMLSSGAFNALLKTLEEPPQHTIFILATTDIEKVPETIVSRCQTFSFNKISNDLIFDRLAWICKKEKIKYDDMVLKNISNISDGGLRDAIGMLDKMVSFSSDKLTVDDFHLLNGTVSDQDLQNLLEAIFDGNVLKVLDIIRSFDICGKNIIQILKQLLFYIRNLIVQYYTENKENSYSISLITDLANIINESMFDIKKSDSVSISMELLLLQFMQNNHLIKSDKNEIVSTNSLSSSKNDIKKTIDHSISKDSIEKKEEKTTSHKKIIKNISNVNILNIDDIMKIRINNVFATANKDLLKKEKEMFEQFKDYTFDSKIGHICCSFLDSKIRAVGPHEIIISFDYDSAVEKSMKEIKMLSEVYQKITKCDKKIAIVSDSEWDSLKKEYINNIKNKVVYSVQEEPEEILEDNKKDDIISNSAIDLFGDIVEIEK